MKQKGISTHCPNFTLSNKYLRVVKKSLEPKIFNEKVEGLFYKIKKLNKASTC